MARRSETQEAIVWSLQEFGAKVCVVGDHDQTRAMNITVTGPCGEGKTSLILLMRQVLESLGMEVIFENPDGPELSRSQVPEAKLREIYAKTLRGKKVTIIERARLEEERV